METHILVSGYRSPKFEAQQVLHLYESSNRYGCSQKRIYKITKEGQGLEAISPKEGDVRLLLEGLFGGSFCC